MSSTISSGVSRLWLAALVPVALIGAGTAGYVAIEGWGVFDALYMTVITLTTIGFLEVHDLSVAGRSWTMILALGGAFSIAGAATYVLRSIVSGEVGKALGKQRMEKNLATIKDHVIVCGYGRVGRLVVDELVRGGVHVVVIERDPRRLEEFPHLHIVGDAADDKVLEHAGIRRARAVVTVVPADADNLYVTMSARLLNDKVFIVARAEADAAEDKLKRAGANRVVSPTAIGGQRVAQAVLRPAVLDFVDLATRTQHLELQMEEIALRAASPLVGQELRAAKLRDRADVLVVAIQKPDGRMVFNPAPDVKFETGDRLVVLGSRGALDALEVIARGG